MYRKSRDGETDFIKSLYGPKTLIVIKNHNGDIFGGFTKVGWKKDTKGYLTDDQAILFNLKNRYGYPVKLECKNPSKAIDYESYYC